MIKLCVMCREPIVELDSGEYMLPGLQIPTGRFWILSTCGHLMPENWTYKVKEQGLL